MAETQSQLEKLDTGKDQLMKGEVANNFHIPRVGYYHAEARDFYEHPFGFARDGQYFVNGVWQNQPVPEISATSRPTEEALKKVEAALEEEQKVAANPQQQQQQQQQGGGFGMGNALMMYWMLSGNRGMFSPGNGFRQASGQAGNWQRGVDDGRGQVNRHAAANPGYQKMVQQSRMNGALVKSGQSVRGGFGASRTGGGASVGG